MKKSIIIVCSFSVLGFLFSCEDDDKSEKARNIIEQSFNLDINPKSISTFDKQQGFVVSADPVASGSTSSIVLSLEDFSLAESGARVRKLGEYNFLINVPIQNDEGEVVLSQEQLLLNNTRVTTYIRLSNDVENGSAAVFPITMFNPVEASVTAASLEAQTSINDTLKYDVTTRSATVDRVEVKQKIFFDGTYEDISNPAGGDWSVEGGQYIFQGEDYAINDTVYFRVKAFSGSLEADVTDIKVFVDTQRIDAVVNENIILEEESNSFSLQTGSTIEDQDLTFINENTQLVGVDDLAINFVKISNNDNMVDTFKEGDLINAQEIFDSGVSTTSIDNFNVDDVYVYQLTREVMDREVTFIGLLKIDQISILDGNGTRSIIISNKEEALVALP